MSKKSLKSNRIMLQCATAVNRDAVRRESIGGVEHIIVSSYTLPDDIVMNGGLYPADEIALGYKSLERTLAPVEHPTDLNGNFISAADPHAIHNFYAGAYNVNVTRDKGRVHIEKFINVQEAMKTDRGKRLLDRINELETSESPRPIHTSVGVWVDVEETEGIQTNGAGQEYSWIARGMVFDHDSLLLDSVGAAQPSQGVGMAVNRDGVEVTVCAYTLASDDTATALDIKEPKDMRTNEFTMSLTELREAVCAGMDRSAIRYDYIEELYSDYVIFESGEQYYTVPYTVDDTTNRVTIVGIPLTVERSVTFNPKVNSEKKGDAMKDLILNALKAADIKTNGLDDQQLFDAYSQLQANQSTENGDDAGKDSAADLAVIVANAMKPLTDKIGALELQLNASSAKEHSELAAFVANSGKYPAIDEETAMLLPAAKLREMAGNCGAAHGIPMHINSGSGQAKSSTATVMPE